MEVFYGQLFLKEYKNYPKGDKEKIANFVLHVQNFGLEGLKGRNKPSHEVCTDDPNWLNKVQYASRHNLWHYHIGIPEYNTQNPEGDWTSEYILHYIRGNGFVKIVDFTSHPPFHLPNDDYLS